MALEKSKFTRKKKPEPNQWREIKVSEEMLRSALEYWFKYSTPRVLLRSEMIEKVIVSEVSDHTYSLSVAIKKEGRSE